MASRREGGFKASVFAVCVAFAAASVINIQVEDFAEDSNIDTKRVFPRSEAGNKRTVWLFSGECISVTVCLPGEDKLTINNVKFSNDGESDIVVVDIDENIIGSFNSSYETSFGSYWNIFADTGPIGRGVSLPAGSHVLTLTVVEADDYGVELDEISVVFGGNYRLDDILCPGNVASKCYVRNVESSSATIDYSNGGLGESENEYSTTPPHQDCSNSSCDTTDPTTITDNMSGICNGFDCGVKNEDGDGSSCEGSGCDNKDNNGDGSPDNNGDVGGDRGSTGRSYNSGQQSNCDGNGCTKNNSEVINGDSKSNISGNGCDGYDCNSGSNINTHTDGHMNENDRTTGNDDNNTETSNYRGTENNNDNRGSGNNDNNRGSGNNGNDSSTGNNGTGRGTGNNGNGRGTGNNGDDSSTGNNGTGRGTGHNGNDSSTGNNGDDSSTENNGTGREKGKNGDDSSTGNNGTGRETGHNGNDSNTGNNGDDSSTGNNGDDSSTGNNGDDSSTGNNGDDSSTGNNGTGRGTGNNGNGRGTGNNGNGRGTGNNGDDSSTGNNGTGRGTGNNGNGRGTGNNGNGRGTGNNGDDSSTGNNGDDSSTGNNGDDSSTGNNGDDSSTGNNGDDSSTGNNGTGRGTGNNGNGRGTGNNGNGRGTGNNGNESSTGNNGTGRGTGNSGNDSSTGNNGDDSGTGNNGNDSSTGNNGDNSSTGNNDNDSSTGNNGTGRGTGNNGNGIGTGNNGNGRGTGNNGNGRGTGNNGNGRGTGNNGTGRGTGNNSDDNGTGNNGTGRGTGNSGNDSGNGNSGLDRDIGSNGNNGDTVNNGNNGDTVNNGNNGDTVNNGNNGDTVNNGNNGDTVNNGNETPAGNSGNKTQSSGDGGDGTAGRSGSTANITDSRGLDVPATGTGGSRNTTTYDESYLFECPQRQIITMIRYSQLQCSNGMTRFDIFASDVTEIIMSIWKSSKDEEKHRTRRSVSEGDKKDIGDPMEVYPVWESGERERSCETVDNVLEEEVIVINGKEKNKMFPVIVNPANTKYLTLTFNVNSTMQETIFGRSFSSIFTVGIRCMEKPAYISARFTDPETNKSVELSPKRFTGSVAWQTWTFPFLVAGSGKFDMTLNFTNASGPFGLHFLRLDLQETFGSLLPWAFINPTFGFGGNMVNLAKSDTTSLDGVEESKGPKMRVRMRGSGRRRQMTSLILSSTEDGSAQMLPKFIFNQNGSALFYPDQSPDAQPVFVMGNDDSNGISPFPVMDISRVDITSNNSAYELNIMTRSFRRATVLVSIEGNKTTVNLKTSPSVADQHSPLCSLMLPCWGVGYGKTAIISADGIQTMSMFSPWRSFKGHTIEMQRSQNVTDDQS